MLPETEAEPSFYCAVEAMLGLPAGEIDRRTRLTDLKGWDSLAILEFMLLASSEYGVDLQPDEIAACTTIGELADATLSRRTLAA